MTICSFTLSSRMLACCALMRDVFTYSRYAMFWNRKAEMEIRKEKLSGCPVLGIFLPVLIFICLSVQIKQTRHYRIFTSILRNTSLRHTHINAEVLMLVLWMCDPAACCLRLSGTQWGGGGGGGQPNSICKRVFAYWVREHARPYESRLSSHPACWLLHFAWSVAALLATEI